MQMRKTVLLGFLIISLMGLGVETLKNTVVVDQVGYLPGFKKIAFLVNPDGSPVKFKIMDTGGNVVFEGKVEKKTDEGYLSGDRVYILDFSDFEKEGEYTIVCGDAKSYPFKIGENVYGDAFKLTMVSYYLQRCGQKVKCGKFHHETCHTQEKEAVYHPATGFKGTKDVRGGWHDAGNYEKYVNNAAFTVAHLLLAYELFKIDVKFIPGYTDDLPHILAEAKTGLDWLMKMQRKDGSVHHSVVVESWDYWICRPGEHKDKRYITSITSFDTAAFAAVMAMAARLYEKFDPEYAAECLRRARLAWGWLENHPEMIPAGGYEPLTETDGYEDNSDRDERLWAAIELFATTGEVKYRRYFEAKYKIWSKTIDYFPYWGDVRVLAMLRYYFTPGTDRKIKEKIKKDLFTFLDSRLRWIDSEDNGYGVALKFDEFWRGSNANLGEIVFMFVMGYTMDRTRKEYLEAAVEQLHYLFGRNALNLSFVTGVGSNAIMNPHHNPSITDDIDEPWPGLVVGGPNADREDYIMEKMVLENTPPMKCFVDHVEAYSVNEPDICYNAPWEFVLASLCH